MHPYFEVIAGAGLAAWASDDADPRNKNGCLIWTGGKTADGYGVVYREPRNPEYVHRISYEAAIERIPDGFHVDHVWSRGCRSRACFWPGHLEAVTPAENNRRMWLAFKAENSRPCGHAWEDNRAGRADCASCHREEDRKRRAINGPSKTARRAQFIRQLAAAGWDDAAIAVEAECSRATVRRVRAGQVHRAA